MFVATANNPLTPVVVDSVSEVTHSSQTLKRKRASKKKVDPTISSASLLAGASDSPHSSAALPIQKVESIEGVIVAMINIRGVCRMVGEYVESLGPLMKEYESRGKRIEVLRAHLLDVEKVIKQCKDMVEKQTEEAIVAREERDSAMGSHAEAEKKPRAMMGELDLLKVDLDKSRSETMVAVKKARENAGMVDKLQGEIQNLEGNALDQYDRGYAEALNHFKCLHPDKDLSVYDPFFEVIDGKLVDLEKISTSDKEKVTDDAAPGPS